MSRLIIISTILVSIITAGIVSLYYLKSTKAEIDVLLSDFLYACENEEQDVMQEKTNRLSAVWSAKQSFMRFFINRATLDNFEEMLVDMDSLTKTESYESAYAQGCRVKYTLNHIYTKEKPTIDNMF